MPQAEILSLFYLPYGLAGMDDYGCVFNIAMEPLEL
jgi:hypothetical protein